MSTELAVIKPAKVKEIHPGKVGEKPGDTFEIIPPKKEGELEAVHCADGKIIRREIGIKNQLYPYEVVQKVEPGESIPRYTYSDLGNSCGIAVARPSLVMPPLNLKELTS